MKLANDSAYIQQAKAGDTRAFSSIVYKYQQLVLALVFRIVDNREDAEDITQEIFIKVFRSLGQFREQSEFSTWLYRIAYNTALSEVRRRKLVFTSYSPDYSSGDEENSEEIRDEIEEHEKEEKLQYLETALKQIPPDEALLISLFYMDNQSIEKISVITNLSIANVKVKLHRIRKKLATEINKLMSL